SRSRHTISTRDWSSDVCSSDLTVLRLSSDRVLIALAPDSLALLRVSGGFRPRVIEKRSIACDPAFGAQPWQGAAAALGKLAEERSEERRVGRGCGGRCVAWGKR